MSKYICPLAGMRPSLNQQRSRVKHVALFCLDCCTAALFCDFCWYYCFLVYAVHVRTLSNSNDNLLIRGRKSVTVYDIYCYEPGNKIVPSLTKIWSAACVSVADGTYIWIIITRMSFVSVQITHWIWLNVCWDCNVEWRSVLPSPTNWQASCWVGWCHFEIL